ncbi:septum formation inhibitor Maf [Arcanobacterium haemolyticum]|nr:septum formation inhibitor Maf [Arcanobacterium haemolyticum]
MTLPHLSLTLASQSPARLATLRAAGISPQVHVSHVDEDALLERVNGEASQKVLALATAKARAVANELVDLPHDNPAVTDLVIGCDSMFEFGGEVVGKPHTPEVARERLRAMSGNSGVLHTGHCLIHLPSLSSLSAVSHARVHVAELSDAEIDAYIASGEPLHVAGSFTVDGRGGPFIDSVEGDYHGVVGISLPLVRQMLSGVGLSVTQLWTDAQPASGELSETGHKYLSRRRPFRARHGADGFILCSCGSIHWGIGGAAGICTFRDRDGEREVLLQLRSSWSHGGNTWSIPGGAIEWDETPLEGALRECAEETQLTDLHVRNSFVDNHGDWAYTTFVTAAPAHAEVIHDDESQELAWFPLNSELPGNLHPSFAAAWPTLRTMVADAEPFA